MAVTRWKIIIQYKGTDFCGWQIQPDGMPTIQEEIESAIFKFCGQRIRITTAGRTDSGVHAHGQVAHFDLDYDDRHLSGTDLAKAINAHLIPHPIAILHAEKISDEFHARFDAKNKLYRYRIITRRAPPVMDRDYVWHIKYKLDIDAMREGAKYLVGHHDFTSFRDTNCQAKSPIRNLNRLDIITKPYDDFDGEEIWFELEAQSFLHHQCRNMVGTLVKIGRGKIPASDIPNILAAKDRAAAGMTSPPEGLSLVRIDY
jgi:tRNA pseudouridine38-40 synthase